MENRRRHRQGAFDLHQGYLLHGQCAQPNPVTATLCPSGKQSLSKSRRDRIDHQQQNIMLFWGQWKYAKTILLDKNLNIGLTWMVPGDKEFTTYVTTMQNDRVDQIQAFVSHIILDNEDADDDASMEPRDLVQALDTDEGESPVDTGTTIQGDEGAMTTFGMQDLAELHILPNDKQPTTLLAQDKEPSAWTPAIQSHLIHGPERHSPEVATQMY